MCAFKIEDLRFKHRLYYKYTDIRNDIIITNTKQTKFQYDIITYSGD